MVVSESTECVVIGAGVIGLAIARALAIHDREVILIESGPQIGMGTSSRNSQVIHAGIYYGTGTQKADLCVKGRDALYQYCKTHGVSFRRCGKLIVATTNEQLEKLKTLHQQAKDNNVSDLIWQDKATTLELEPQLNALASLLSPSTGIIDSHQLMLAYQGDAESLGTMIAFNSPVTGGEITDSAIMLNVGGATPTKIRTKYLFNSGGLHAQEIAKNITGFPKQYIPESHFAKGNYFALSGKCPFTHLIYPIPEEAGLGVHLTLDLSGQARFGPDVEWINKLNYEVNPARAESFYKAIRSYWPGLEDNSLNPDFAGIRPKLHGRGYAASDFVIQGPDIHGIQGLVNLFGIESPGLTASLTIADKAIQCL